MPMPNEKIPVPLPPDQARELDELLRTLPPRTPAQQATDERIRTALRQMEHMKGRKPGPEPT
jgi:hypothetical protein